MVTKYKKKELTNCRDTQGTRNNPCPHFTWICLRNYCSETPFGVWGWPETTFLQVPVHYYKTLTFSVKGHRIEDLFQTLMTRSVCSSWLLTLGIKHKRLAGCLQTCILQWVFPLGRHNLAHGIFAVHSMPLFFSLSGGVKNV